MHQGIAILSRVLGTVWRHCWRVLFGEILISEFNCFDCKYDAYVASIINEIHIHIDTGVLVCSFVQNS